MFWRFVERTGWTWEYMRAMPLPRMWKLLDVMAEDAKALRQD